MTIITNDQIPEALALLDQKLDNIERLLSAQTPQILQDEILNVEEAGLVVKKSKPTMYSLVSKRLIPHSKRGNRLYFSKSELLSWIAEGRKKTNAELNLEADNFLNSQRRGGKN